MYLLSFLASRASADLQYNAGDSALHTRHRSSHSGGVPTVLITSSINYKWNLIYIWPARFKLRKWKSFDRLIWVVLS